MTDKVITHEEVRKFLSNFDYWLNESTSDLVCKFFNNYITQQEKKDKLLVLYKQAYDKSNAEVLKMFTMKQDEKTTLNNIIGHLDDNKTVAQIRALENWRVKK